MELNYVPGFKAVEFGGGLLTCPKKDLVAARERAGVEVAVLCCPAASMDKCKLLSFSEPPFISCLCHIILYTVEPLLKDTSEINTPL